MGEAARIVDRIAHRHAGGRWLATGGGGYDAYRVVPRAWALTWLAGAHREPPPDTPPAWRERWAAEASHHRQAPLPTSFVDPPNAGIPFDADQEEAERRSRATAALVRRLFVPRLLREAADRGWWASADPPSTDRAGSGVASPGLRYRPAVIGRVDAATWARLTLVPRVVAPADPDAAHALLLAALRDGARVSAALDETRIVGVLVSRWSNELLSNEILALGVAPAARRAGLATRLVDAHLGLLRPGEDGLRAEVTVGERDAVEPLDRAERTTIARRLLERAGCAVRRAPGDVGLADPEALLAIRD
jgi:ribosomal protein S18 acetylase RimI-like enzyme